MALDSKTPMTAAEFAALMGQQDFTKMQHPLEWWLERATITIDQAGTPHFAVNTSGQAYSVEASGASIQVNTGYVANGLTALTPLVATPPSLLSSAACLAAAHRVYTVNVPIAAGGAVTNVALHATMAGYKFHFKVLGMWSSVADITTTWWFHTTAGAVSCVGCPATPGFVVTALAAANTLYTPLNGAYMNNAAATGDVTLLDVAGVGAGAANLYIFLEGWFEAL